MRSLDRDIKCERHSNSYLVRVSQFQRLYSLFVARMTFGIDPGGYTPACRTEPPVGLCPPPAPLGQPRTLIS